MTTVDVIIITDGIVNIINDNCVNKVGIANNSCM